MLGTRSTRNVVPGGELKVEQNTRRFQRPQSHDEGLRVARRDRLGLRVFRAEFQRRGSAQAWRREAPRHELEIV